MKRARVHRIAGRLLTAPAGAGTARPATGPFVSTTTSTASITTSSSPSSSAAAAASLQRPPQRRLLSTTGTAGAPVPGLDVDAGGADPRFPELVPAAARAAAEAAYPSPLPERARSSAKLAALHARLGLSQRLPLETLARTLVDASADPSPRFHNASLAYLGSTLMHYHASEWLLCRYPRLPMVILYAAMKAYAGPQALADVARQWGVEAAAAPGPEVDPGLLQFSLRGGSGGGRQAIRRWGYQRAEAAYLKKFKWRHGISSRVVLDDDFGDTLDETEGGEVLGGEGGDEARLPAVADAGGSLDAAAKTRVAEEAHANFVRAVTGAVYAHGGREAVRAFVHAHVLSRQLDLASLFRFKLPTRELAYLCAREGFAPPVARLEAETGRHSRTPVYVVGIYSGADKLGEGAAASLDHARAKAAMNCLKAWYLYSPGEQVRLPSDMLLAGAAPWEPAYVDIGEIL